MANERFRNGYKEGCITQSTNYRKFQKRMSGIFFSQFDFDNQSGKMQPGYKTVFSLLGNVCHVVKSLKISDGPNKYKWRGNFFNFVFDLKNQ